MQSEHEILKMEHAALDRWAKGDPSGFIEISAPDVVYFDPYAEHRVDGRGKLTVLYESIRGQIHLDRYEIIDPLVQECGAAAILTFNYAGYAGEKVERWNCTEVYRKDPQGWRIVQTHWSRTLARDAGK